MILAPHKVHGEENLDAEALIEEARRRQRRRRRYLGGALAVVLAGAVVGLALTRQGAPGQDTTQNRDRISGLPHAAVFVTPKAPDSMALGPNGNLFIVDDGRDQILERLRDGKFVVVAGDGHKGFSGDGGPAVKAELADPGGIAFGAGGTLYVADEGNNRIRKIAPSGLISTLVGAGSGGGPVANGTPALRAHLLSPDSVTVGRDRELYIADAGNNEILRLGPRNKLTVVAGGLRVRYAGVYNMGRPAAEASPDGPMGMAFDRAGDLFLFGDNTKTLLMIDPQGVIHAIVGGKPGTTGFYPHASTGIVSTPDGKVLALDGTSIDRITPTGIHAMIDFSTSPSFRDWRGFLPNGIAVKRNGSIDVDTDGASGYTSTPGLVEIGPGGHVHVLWKPERRVEGRAEPSARRSSSS